MSFTSKFIAQTNRHTPVQLLYLDHWNGRQKYTTHSVKYRKTSNMRMSSTISARDTLNVKTNDLFQTGELVDGQTSVCFNCRRTDSRQTGLMLFPCSCLPSTTRTRNYTQHTFSKHIQRSNVRFARQRDKGKTRQGGAQCRSLQVPVVCSYF